MLAPTKCSKIIPSSERLLDIYINMWQFEIGEIGLQFNY